MAVLTNDPKVAGLGSADSGLVSLVLPVLGMSCAACQLHVQGALAEATGVRAARVDLMRHRATIEFDPLATAPQNLVEVIRNSGYESVLPRGDAAQPEKVASDLWAGSKALVTIVAGVVAMILSMALPGMMGQGWFDHAFMHVLPWVFAIPQALLLWGLLTVTAALAVWAGAPIYASAWKALRHRETNMNTLVSLGTGVAFFYSGYVAVWQPAGGNVYFDSVLLILGFLLLGKWLEGRARHRALAAVDALAHLQPGHARVRQMDGQEILVALDAVAVGHAVVILPGERVPVDGVIESGRTTVDESMLTGEAVPLERAVGGQVLAGSVNYDGAIVVRVESAGEGTTLRQIARLVEQAQGSRAPMERLADRASSIFVPIVLGLAVLTFAGWLIATHSLALAIAPTVAVLVIACPCAMGLAVPAALTVAIGRGAQFGVLIKGGDALERLAGLEAIAMDKTGTLTEGKPALVGMVSLNGMPDETLLRIAAAVEDHSAHPLAHAVVARARELALTWATAEDVQILPGRGVSASVEGKRCLLGNLELMRDEFVPLPANIDSALADPSDGVTRLWMALEVAGSLQLAGYFDAKDTVRSSAKSVVAWLHEQGMRVTMLTGDSQRAAGVIASTVGIENVSAGLMPADKVAQVREMQKTQRVGMVGDGINDAAALAQADAGIAMGTGAALAQEAGDVLLLRSDPAGVCTAIALARATVRVMRQNLGWAVGYNVIGIPLAAGLLYPLFHLALTPWMAAAAMAFSSVSVLLNSLRLKAWREPSVV